MIERDVIERDRAGSFRPGVGVAVEDASEAVDGVAQRDEVVERLVSEATLAVGRSSERSWASATERVTSPYATMSPDGESAMSSRLWCWRAV